LTGRLIIGQYKPSNSYVHRLDPRAKIFLAVYLMVVSVFTSSALFYLTAIAGICTLLLISHVTVASIIQSGKPFVILVSFTALYHIIFSGRDSAAVVDFYGLRLTQEGLRMAASFSLRVLVFAGIAFFISLTTAPADIAEALVGWMKPLKKLRVPVNEIGLIIFIAMRFIPVLIEEFDTIRKAQMVRGVDFSGGMINKARKSIYLLIPVFQSAIRRADELAVAIESRGYTGGSERSSYRQFRWRPGDSGFVVVSVAVVTGLFYMAG